MEVTVTLKRIFQKGFISFEAPKEEEIKEALISIFKTCKDRHNDFVSCTFKPPYKPRTTGAESQNHHLNGHIMQICNVTGNDYETIKYCVKMTAVEQFGFPFTELTGHIIPKRERDCNTEECGKLIEAVHYLAAQLEIILREE